MDGGVPRQVYMSHGGFIPPMVHAWCMHGPFSVLSRYLSAFEFLALVLMTTTLTFNMAASSGRQHISPLRLGLFCPRLV